MRTPGGVVLLELQDRGLKLEQVVADGGTGLRAGHREAGSPQIDYDPFHLIQAVTELVGDLRRRARRLHKRQCELERKMARAARQGLQGRDSARLGQARQRARAAADLHEHVERLVQRLSQDILAPSAMSPAMRRHLYDWVVEQLRAWEDACEQECLHRIGPVRRLLAHVVEGALAFAPGCTPSSCVKGTVSSASISRGSSSSCKVRSPRRMGLAIVSCGVCSGSDSGRPRVSCSRRCCDRWCARAARSRAPTLDFDEVFDNDATWMRSTFRCSGSCSTTRGWSAPACRDVRGTRQPRCFEAKRCRTGSSSSDTSGFAAPPET